MSDFDWPGLPYTEYLRQQLAAQAEYEYINPSLSRRYDPVVVGGNAMHPIIQRGDVILIDTGNNDPEDGRAVAVRLGGGRTVIGYWRMRGGAPVLEQEQTNAVINLSEHPGWEIYGVVTKIIGRTIAPHRPEEGAGSDARTSGGVDAEVGAVTPDGFDMVALAQRIHRRLRSYELRHRMRPKITSTLSRILENDPEYRPYRARRDGKKRPPAADPSLRSIMTIARSLECSVGELLGERTIGAEDIRTLRRIGIFLQSTFRLSAPHAPARDSRP